MRNVDVATQDEFPLAFELHDVRVEFRQKAKLGELALFARRAAGKIRTDNRQFARGGVKAQFDIAPFRIECFRSVTHHNVRGLVAGINAHPRVAFFLGKVKVTVQICQTLEPVGYVRRLGFDFLHANTIRPCGCYPAFHTFAGGRADAVEIEAG